MFAGVHPQMRASADWLPALWTAAASALSEMEQLGLHPGSRLIDDFLKRSMRHVHIPIAKLESPMSRPEIRADRLAAAMKDIDLNQSALAREVGVTPAAIQQLVSGKTKQSVHLSRIAAVLGVQIPWLLGESDDPIDHVAIDSNIFNMPLWSLMIEPPATMWQDIGLISYDFRVIPAKNIDENNFGMFTNIGDEMSPTLNHDDRVVVDLNSRHVTGPDSIWLVSTPIDRVGENWFFCRISRTSDGRFQLHKDAPTFRSKTLGAAEFSISGRVVWVGRSTP